LKKRFFKQTYRACFDCLSDVSQLIHQAANAAGLDEQSLYQAETAVDEACANIIEHAYGGENRGDITIECTAEIGELTIKIMDHGKAFNPNEVSYPKLDLALKERPDRGLGIFFMRRWMDSVRFEFTENQGNTLTMIKKAGGTS
jgi:serine/threonine-protein kinase RsbW